MKQRKQDDLNEIIASENLKADETTKFVENAFRDGAIRTTGTDTDKILPAMSRSVVATDRRKEDGSREVERVLRSISE